VTPGDPVKLSCDCGDEDGVSKTLVGGGGGLLLRIKALIVDP